MVPAELWIEVDRVAVCVHRPTSGREAFRQLVEELDLPAGGIIVSAARHLASGRVSLTDLALLSRYESRSAVAANVERHVELGLLERASDDAFIASARFQAAAVTVLREQGESARELWLAREVEVVALARVASRLVRLAASRHVVATPAFDAQVRHHEVIPSTPFAQLLAFVTELRYLRSDLHAAALFRHDLAGPRARALHRLWKGQPITDHDARRLEQRALATRSGDGWLLTEDGSAIRDEVERVTDEITAEALRDVSDSDLDDFLSGLAALPGEDPRPLQDR
jgi:hypothetical protein